MSLRRYMNIITESYYDDERDEDEEGFDGDAPALETHVLAAGTTVYHGTNGQFNERNGLDSPSWVTDSIETAKYFSTWNGGKGKPRITVWNVTTDTKLAVITKEYFDWLEEYQMISLTDGPEDILQHLRQKGFDGWIIPDNYGTRQADICLNDTSILDYVKTVRHD